MNAIVKKNNLKGNVYVPGSKSHTIRAILIAAMAEGKSTIKRPLLSEDCKSAAKVAEDLGAKIEIKDEEIIIEGVNGKFKVPDNIVDCGNSGTTTYITCSLAATIEGTTVITGDAQIRKRPIKTLIESLNQTNGVKAFVTRPDVDAPPVVITGPMKPGKVILEGKISPQVSGVLLAAPLLNGTTEVVVKNPLEIPYVNITLDWMKGQGVEIEHNGKYDRYIINGPQKYQPVNRSIPADWSGVAFPLIGAVMTNSDVLIEGVDFDDAQGDKEIVDILIRMGADITKDTINNRLIIKGGKELNGVEVDCRNIPDTLPALSVIGAYAKGNMKLTGLEVVRLKETDRVAVMYEELTKMGVDISVGEDEVLIKGGKGFNGTIVDSHDDHRVAMALMMAGLLTEEDTVVLNVECANVSFPNFIAEMNRLGANIKVSEEVLSLSF